MDKKTFGALFRVKTVLPLLLAGALLAVALSLGNIGRVADRLATIPIGTLLLAFGMAVVYCLLKYCQFHRLLVGLGETAAWQKTVSAFAVGELALTLPFGIFAQNWLLSATGSSMRFAHNSAATLGLLIVESVAVLTWLAVVGIPHWPASRPVAAAVALGTGLFIPVLLRLRRVYGADWSRLRHRWMQRLFANLSDLLDGCERLITARILVLSFGLSACYLGALALAFWQVGRGVGLTGLDYPAAATIYAFSLAVVLLGGGLLSHIGTVEVLGMGAARTFGIDWSDGLALMLGFRLVWTGAIWLINLPIVILLWPRLSSRS